MVFVCKDFARCMDVRLRFSWLVLFRWQTFYFVLNHSSDNNCDSFGCERVANTLLTHRRTQTRGQTQTCVLLSVYSFESMLDIFAISCVMKHTEHSLSEIYLLYIYLNLIELFFLLFKL